jgi:hypothetical protein
MAYLTSTNYHSAVTEISKRMIRENREETKSYTSYQIRKTLRANLIRGNPTKSPDELDQMVDALYSRVLRSYNGSVQERQMVGAREGRKKQVAANKARRR